LTSIYQHKTGTSDKGPWSYQDAVLKDETGVIKMKFWGREPWPQAAKGKVIQLSSVKGAHGWTGLTKKTNSYKGVDTPFLNVTATAEIIDFNAEAEPEDVSGLNSLPGSTDPIEKKHAELQAQLAATQEQLKKLSATKSAQKEAPQGPYPAESGTPSMATGNRPPEKDGTTPTTKPSREAEAASVFYQLANAQYTAVMIVRKYLVPLLASKGEVLDPVQEAALIQNMLIQGYRHNVNLMFRSTKLPFEKKEEPVASTDAPVEDPDNENWGQG
jgi:hypothetical protein